MGEVVVAAEGAVPGSWAGVQGAAERGQWMREVESRRGHSHGALPRSNSHSFRFLHASLLVAAPWLFYQTLSPFLLQISQSQLNS